MKNLIKAVFAVLIIVFLTSIVLPVIASEPAPNSSHTPGAADGNQSSAGPVRIELRDERAHVMANDADNIKLTAIMYDAQGNPVADGYRVNFTIGNATDNNFTGNGNFDYVPGAMGRLGSPGNPYNFYQGATVNNSGSISVQFGWIDELYSGNNSTIWAYSDDNASIFASTKVYSSAPTDSSWTGYIVDSSGAGIGGIPVIMHVMGMNNTTPYEIYNMTRTTCDQPYAGIFTFDYIVLTGAVYGYVDAEVRLPDNATIYVKSDNFSMNRSTPSIGTIVLRATATVSPAATSTPIEVARPSPGFEAAFFTAGCLGAAYLMARKKEL